MAPSEVPQGNPFGRSKVGTRRLATPARIAAPSGREQGGRPGFRNARKATGTFGDRRKGLPCTPGISGAGLILRSLYQFAELIRDVSHGPGLSVEFPACRRTLFCAPAQAEGGRSAAPVEIGRASCRER